MESVRPTLREIGEALLAANTLVIASHARPDGDALGSQIALSDTLREIGKTVISINEDAMPSRYAFLPCSNSVRQASTLKDKAPPHLFVALDCADPDRLGDHVWKYAASRQATLVIDHHASNHRFGDVNFVDIESPATGQIVFELIETMGWPLTATARDNLWAAIATDTGSFQYPATTPRTFQIGARLLDAGLDLSRMSAMLFQNQPFRRLELLRELLGTIERTAEGKVASWRLSQEIIKRLGIQPDDNEGLIDLLRSIAGVIVAVSFEETPNAMVRISARSKDASRVDVSRICQAFGGGGHRLAAGAQVQGTLDSVAERFLAALSQELHHGTT